MILGFHCWGPGSTPGRGTEILQAKKQNKKIQAPYTGEWDPPGSSLSMEFSMQEYWSGLPCPPPGDLPDPGNEPRSPALQADSFPLSHQSKVKWLRRARLFVTPWTVAYQALPSMGFSRQDYWSGLPFPSPGDLLNPGIKLESAVSPDCTTCAPCPVTAAFMTLTLTFIYCKLNGGCL